MCDFADTKGGVDYFMNDVQDRDTAVPVLAGLEGLLAMKLTNEQYLQLLDIVGVEYSPEGEAQDWLVELRDRFAWHLERQGPTDRS